MELIMAKKSIMQLKLAINQEFMKHGQNVRYK